MIKRLLNLVYYYLLSTYKIWRIKRVEIDDIIYTTETNIQICVYPGKKAQSPYDFIVKYKEPNKRERTPAHVHMVVEMYVKHAYNPELTIKFKDHILGVFQNIKPVSKFPPELQYFKKEHIEPFKDLNKAGDFTIEFMLVVTELILIQEKTNYPEGSLTERLYKDFCIKDRFSIIQKAVWRN